MTRVAPRSKEEESRMNLLRTEFIRAAKILGTCLACMATAVAALAQSVSTTTVQGTVYLADGSPGSGTLQLSWPAFTTASSQAVAAGKISTTIGVDGFLSVNLAPNLGSSPAGLYYTAIYHMSNGATSTEYWVVPAAAQASIAQVRSQVMPAAQAVQAVSKAYVDQAIQSVAQGNLTSTGGQLTGPLYLTGDPTQSLQAADKHYVDSSFAQAVPMSGGAVNGPLTAQQLGAAYQVDRFSGADFGAKLQACVAAIDNNYGGTCDARNFSGTITMSANLTISTGNTTVMLPCATISTASQMVVAAGTRNVSLRGCALRGASNASGSQGGTVLLYSGTAAAIQVGDQNYASNTLGFHLENVVINTTAATSANAQAFAAFRTQEIDLESLYLLGNSNQTGLTLDGTGNYTGGTFFDNHISGYQTAINGIGHQITNSAATDWMNASTFVRLHIDCPTANGNPIAGTSGVNLQQGDGNTFTGGDVENCGTAVHLGANAQNNTIVGLRNENSISQVVADPGSSYNSWMTGGTMFTGKLTDNGTRNSFLDAFHRSFNSLNGDWYGSQQDATLTNHYRLGIGSGSERGLLDRYQTDNGYRWTTGFSDATGGEQFYQVLDELNGVNRLSIGQYNNGQPSTNNQTVINSAGTGAVVLNGSNNAGTGGVVFGSGGANESTVATVSNNGNAQFNGALQVGGTTQSAGTVTVRNGADSEVDYYLWPGLSSSQKGSFTYKDWNGISQWYMLKDASNNWALNSAAGGLDSFKAYQSTNSGDTYINASNASGVVRVNYETGAGSAFNVYGGNSSNLYASFSGNTSIKFPGLSASSGHNCLQIDSSGFITNTGAACSTGGGNGTVNSGSTGQIAYYNSNGAAISGMSTIPVSSGGTGASTASGALAVLGGLSMSTTAAQSLAGPLNASVNSQVNVMSFGAKGDCTTNDHDAIMAAQMAAQTYRLGNSQPAVVYFPKPPGGCYLTSTVQWMGISLVGQPGGKGVSSPHSYSVTLKGMPGQDILATPDPALVGTFTFNVSWTIRDISFLVDTSVSNLHPHRYVGRWFDDAAITAASSTFTSTRAQIGCGDIGQAIIVGGAGSTVTTTTLAADITTTAQSSIQISDVTSSSWPTIFGYLKIDSEILMYVGTQTNGISTITVMRGQAGTTAATHSTGATVTVMGNLTTTIASVSPCWATSANSTAWKTVTLATPATTTVASAHSYISLLGLAGTPATDTLGNCAIAMDNMDALNTDWPNPSVSLGSNSSSMFNVSFATTNGSTAGSNNCGIFVQGAWILYSSTFDQLSFYSETFPVVQGAAELNSKYGGFGDFQDWEHMFFFTDWYPWISYNGGENKFKNVEITALAGPQFMSLSNTSADVTNWDIELQELESWSITRDSIFGLRTTGRGDKITGQMSISADANNAGYIDSISASCPLGCFADAGGIYLYGAGNSVQNSTGSPVRNLGKGNTVTRWYNASWPNGTPAPAPTTVIPQKGVPNLLAGIEPDFAADGYPATPYRHEDYFMTPGDILIGVAGTSQWSGLYQDDTASLTGGELFISPGVNLTGFQQFESTNPGNAGNMTIGVNFPAAKGVLYLSLKCPTATVTQININSSSGKNNTLSISTCSTNLQTFAVPFDFTSATGNIGIKNSGTSGQDFWLSWAYIEFAPQLPAGTTIAGAGVVSGPSSGTAAGDLVCYSNTTGAQQDCNASAATNNITSAGSNIFTISSTGGTAYMALHGGSTGNNTLYRWYAGATGYWDLGMGSTSAMSMKDEISTRTILSFPSNTMPTNSLSGNVNGATAITQPAADNSTNIATDAFVKANLPFAGTTGSIGGSALAAGACTSGTVNVTGATTSMAVVATPATYPGDGMAWRPYVSAAGVVTVKVCAEIAGTPTISTYNVRIIP
jgi:hypothetical protein